MNSELIHSGSAPGGEPGPFFLGQLPVEISQPPWVAQRNRYIARVVVGTSWHSVEAKTPARAARWLAVRTRGLYAYADAVQAGCDFREAARARRRAIREALVETAERTA